MFLTFVFVFLFFCPLRNDLRMFENIQCKNPDLFWWFEDDIFRWLFEKDVFALVKFVEGPCVVRQTALYSVLK